MKKLIIVSEILGVVVVVGLFFTYLFFINHVSLNEVGVAYDSRNGSLTIQSNAGWYVTSPFVTVAKLSTLPMTVHIPSTANVINTKIVRLKVEGIPELVKMQGFGYSLGAGLDNIFMGYAFSGKSYSFMEVVQEAGPEQSVTK